MKLFTRALLIGCVSAAVTARGQVPALINFQGKLIDGTNLANGNVSLVLRLFNAASGGTAEYVDSNDVAVVDGLYSTFLGDDTIDGSLAAALTNAEVWVEVEIGGTVLSPRERLASVAYALTAGSVPGLEFTNYVEKTGDTMTGVLTVNVGGPNSLVIGSAGTDILIGNGATADLGGLAVGANASGKTGGTALGTGAKADTSGIAIGDQSGGTWSGVAIGRDAKGTNYGVAVGRLANGNNSGLALGYNAVGVTGGVAIGYTANGAGGGIAIGSAAQASDGTNRIAIGRDINNAINDSIAVRGTLYLDGGTGIYTRAVFGSGAWNNVANLPVPVVNVWSNYTVSDFDHDVFAVSNSFTIALPPASAARIGRVYYIHNVGAGAVQVQATNGTDMLNGVVNGSNAILQYETRRIIGFSATEWIASP